VEFGGEFRFLNDRLGLDLTYYDRTSRDQIIGVPISSASGFLTRQLNAGTMTNKGIDLGVDLTPIRTSNFEWSVRANYNRNRNRVVELNEGTEALVIASFWGVDAQARVGEAFGSLVGNPQLRVRVDANGNAELDENGDFIKDRNGVLVYDEGYPVLDAERQVLGNYNPDWVGSLANTFKFRNLSMNVLLDARKGGEIYSVTNMFGRYAGVLEETAAGRCDGALPACTEENSMTINGVDASTGEAMTWHMSANEYWPNTYSIHDLHIDDASFVKLREVSLGYDAPQSFARRLGLSGFNLAVTGRNLALWAESDHIDPETAFDASNAQGFEFGQLPTARSIGVNITVTP
jgi:hypothetical protein